MNDALPLPPPHLANRVGQLKSSKPWEREYEELGKVLRDVVDQALPADWSWERRRALDFGSGAGRVLRHFAPEAETASFEGCDIDREAIAWLEQHLHPPFTGFVCDDRPPLERDDATYDVVYAWSVFTHITNAWADWLLELRRVLKPDGWLIASFLGSGMSQAIADEPWIDERVGMNVLHAHRSWEHGGPSVLLSSWWIREHWGRAFEIVSLDEGGPGTHGLVVARPNSREVSVDDLHGIDPREEREILALRHNLAQLQRDNARLAANDHARSRESGRHALAHAARRLLPKARLR